MVGEHERPPIRPQVLERRSQRKPVVLEPTCPLLGAGGAIGPYWTIACTLWRPPRHRPAPLGSSQPRMLKRDGRSDLGGLKPRQSLLLPKWRSRGAGVGEVSPESHTRQCALAKGGVFRATKGEYRRIHPLGVEYRQLFEEMEVLDRQPLDYVEQIGLKLRVHMGGDHHPAIVTQEGWEPAQGADRDQRSAPRSDGGGTCRVPRREHGMRSSGAATRPVTAKWSGSTHGVLRLALDVRVEGPRATVAALGAHPAAALPLAAAGRLDPGGERPGVQTARGVSLGRRQEMRSAQPRLGSWALVDPLLHHMVNCLPQTVCKLLSFLGTRALPILVKRARPEVCFRRSVDVDRDNVRIFETHASPV